jgi:predicted membrane protein
MNTWIIDGVGMLGMVMVVLAYYLLQLERVDPKSLSYNLINLIGAILLLISLWFHFNLASFVIEIFWIAASLIGLWKYWRRQNSEGQSSS